jgi:UDP-glucuronate 4-epimerase
MSILVTGAAGFTGFHTANALLERGEGVVGIDTFNDYYAVELKRARLEPLCAYPDFRFVQIDIGDRDAVFALCERHGDLCAIIHLAAQAGVRHSLESPSAYVDANVMGTLVMLEAARRIERLSGLTYASSSSVYGGNAKRPFAVGDRVDRPLSLYAATKRCAELIVETYSRLYGLPATGLRYFTVYGPWGRPDMAAWLFTRAILAGEPIEVFNQGRMMRDFTYIDDAVAGTSAAHDRPPADDRGPHVLYNLANHHPENLLDFIATLERLLGRTATKELLPPQPGDAPETFADIETARRDLGFEPKTGIADGLACFVAWYKAWHRLD